MSYDDHGDALLPVQADEDVKNLLPGLAVEIAGGFVGEEDGRVLYEGAGYAYALLLAAGQFGWLMTQTVSKTEAFEGFPGASFACDGVPDRRGGAIPRWRGR